MKLKKDSILSKLYRWFYLTDQMPKNLCPYFWKLVIMVLFIIPTFIISAPSIILRLIDSRAYEKFDNGFQRIGINFILYGMLFLIFMMLFSISYLFGYRFLKDSFPEILQSVGLLIWCGLLGVLLVLSIRWIYTSIKNKRVGKEQDPNIVLEFIKSKYNNYCPKIDWE